MGLLKFVEMKIVCYDNVLGILGIEKSNSSRSIVCLYPSKQVNCLNLCIYVCTEVLLLYGLLQDTFSQVVCVS